MREDYFYLVINNLRQNEEILLYDSILQINESELVKVEDFLQSEFENESLSFPFTVPSFNKSASLWSAKIVYYTAQLILYREHSIATLKHLFNDYQEVQTPSAILSADICLRFLPSMIIQLKMIDQEDELIEILEKILIKWHYSAINYNLEIEQLNFDNIINNKCLHQLYVNRVIEHKKIKLALHPSLLPWVKASLGIYSKEFWNELNTEIQANE